MLGVARKYKELGIALDVIVIDFFHWTRQGDWKFDAEYWPDPKAMCDELHAMGTKIVVSVWPTVDKKSENFAELFDRGLLIQTEHGSNQTYEFQGDCLTIDVTNPEAQEYLWEKCKKNYYDYGIDMFWLDNAEPDYSVYDFDNYRYYAGSALEVSNVYPKLYVKTFYEQTKALSLVRCGWAGSQKYASLLWSGDIPSTFESLRDQMIAGLHMGLAGIPWGGIAGHTFIGLHKAENSYFHRAMCAQDYSAVTAACMMSKGIRSFHRICRHRPPQQPSAGGYRLRLRSLPLQ